MGCFWKRAVEMSEACLLGLQIESWYVVTIYWRGYKTKQPGKFMVHAASIDMWSLVETRSLILSGKLSTELSAAPWKLLEQHLMVHLRIGGSWNYMALQIPPNPMFCIRCLTHSQMMAVCFSSFLIPPTSLRQQEIAGLQKLDYSGYVSLKQTFTYDIVEG